MASPTGSGPQARLGSGGISTRPVGSIGRPGSPGGGLLARRGRRRRGGGESGSGSPGASLLEQGWSAGIVRMGSLTLPRCCCVALRVIRVVGAGTRVLRPGGRPGGGGEGGVMSFGSSPSFSSSLETMAGFSRARAMISELRPGSCTLNPVGVRSRTR